MFECWLFYAQNVKKNFASTYQDPFGEKRGSFDYNKLLGRLEAIKVQLADKIQDSSDETSDSDMDTSANESCSESVGKIQIGKDDVASSVAASVQISQSNVQDSPLVQNSQSESKDSKTVIESANGLSSSVSTVKPDTSSDVQMSEVNKSTIDSKSDNSGSCVDRVETNLGPSGSSVDPLKFSAKMESTSSW